MRKHQMTLVSDFYKQGHESQFPNGVDFIASYFTPRMSRVEEQSLIVWGVQGFAIEYLIELFNETFFNVPLDEVVNEYNRVIKATLTPIYCKPDKIIALHKLGYLPIEIKALPEGTMCPIHVPCIEITNTHKEFAWFVQFVESIMSCQLWYPMVIANQAYKYRKIADKYYGITSDVKASSAISEFGFRGAEGREGAILASCAFLTSFNRTATTEAILYLEDYYRGILEDGSIAKGMLSTEHSVMCSNYAIDGDEEIFIKRLLTDIYPTENISMVSDSYDYWKLLKTLGKENIKNIITNRDGTLFVRGDSGDPVDIICGELRKKDYMCIEGLTEDNVKSFYKEYASKNWKEDTSKCFNKIRIGDDLYSATAYFNWENDVENSMGGYYTSAVDEVEIEKTKITPAMKGTVELLWEIFGGNINSKGYKVLDSHIKAIYGDSITPARAEAIYERLMEKEFASNNVALGAGSFSMQCAEENGQLKPFTRDTYGIAIKATYIEVNGTPIEVFKNPKTDTGNFKKSQKGMCYVYKNDSGEIVYKDGFNRNNIPDNNMLRTVFKDGKLIVEESIYDIRNRIHEDF